MALYRLKKWGVRKPDPYGYRELGELSININSLSIRVSDQKLCLSEVELPFLDSTNFTPTYDVFSRTFNSGSGCQISYSKMYS